MSTSQKRGSKVLAIVEKADAERFLLDLANFRTEGKTTGAERVFRRNEKIVGSIGGDFKEKEGMPVKGWFNFALMQRMLRRAWDAKDDRTRDWESHQIRTFFLEWEHQDDPAFKDPNKGLPDVTTARYWHVPPVPPLEATMWHFQKFIGDLAKRCLNANCPAPYFIAAKRSQKYCSVACSAPAKLQAKRNWWRDIGDERRRKVASR